MAFLDKTGLEHLWAQIVNKLSGKVDKVDGKGLSANDYTTEEKEQLANLTNLVGDTSVSEQIASNSPVKSVNGETGAVSVTVLNGISGGAFILQKTGDDYIPTIIGTDGHYKLAIQNNSSFPHIMSYHYYDQSTGTWLGGANIYSTVNKPTAADVGISSGTYALTAGSSALTTGTIYIQFE